MQIGGLWPRAAASAHFRSREALAFELGYTRGEERLGGGDDEIRAADDESRSPLAKQTENDKDRKS